MLDGHLPHAGHILASTAHQHAAVALHATFCPCQLFAHKVDQCRRGDFEAVRVGAIGQQVKGLSWLEGQHLRQGDFLYGQEVEPI